MVKTDDPKTQTIALLKGYGPFSKQEKESAIFTAIGNASLLSSNRDKGKPGELVKMLKPETRNVLKDCKSDDWNHRI